MSLEKKMIFKRSSELTVRRKGNMLCMSSVYKVKYTDKAQVRVELPHWDDIVRIGRVKLESGNKGPYLFIGEEFIIFFS